MDKFKSKRGLQYQKNLLYITAVLLDISKYRSGTIGTKIILGEMGCIVIPFVRNIDYQYSVSHLDILK